MGDNARPDRTLLKKRQLPFVRLDGSVPQKLRQSLVYEFQNNPGCRLFLTTNAGSTGLNLQAANTVINVEKGYRSDLVVVDANHLDQIVRKFEISDPPFGGLDEPQIQWSLDGKRMALGGKVFPIEGPSYCGRGEVRGFLGGDRFLAFIPSEMVRLFGVGREQPARRLYLVGPGCDDEVRVPTHELNWFLEDFSAQRNIALFDRLHGP